MKMTTETNILITPSKGNKRGREVFCNTKKNSKNLYKDFCLNSCRKLQFNKKIINSTQFILNGVLCEYNDNKEIISFNDKDGEWSIFEFIKYDKLKFELGKNYSLEKMKNMLKNNKN